MAPGDYALTDKMYAEWLHKLHKAGFRHLTPDARQYLLQFYEAAATTLPSEEAETPDKREKRELQQDVEALRALPEY